MKKYFLYDSQTKVQHQKLSFQEVTDLYKNTLPSERENLYGWYKGQADWLPLKEIPEFSALFSLESRPEYEDINYDPSEKTHIPSYTGIHNLEKLVESSQITFEKSAAKPKLELKIKIQPKVPIVQAPQAPQAVQAPAEPTLPKEIPSIIPTSAIENKNNLLATNSVIETPLEKEISTPLNNPTTSPVEPLKPVAELTGRERRKFTRYDIKLRVIITNKKNTFLTFTKDVSLGGLQLMNDIPEYIFQGESEVFISGPNNRDNIKFKCKAIGDNIHKSRLQFEDSDQKLLEKLQLWIDHIVKPQAKSA